MVWEDDGYSMWDEVKKFYSKAWTQRCEPVALSEFMDATAYFDAYTVLKALRKIFREQERPLRPSVKQVLNKCYEVKSEARRLESQKNPQEKCQWCEGSDVQYVCVYPVLGKELPHNFSPTEAQRAVMKQMSSNAWLIEPETAKKRKRNLYEERLWCHHCKEAGENPTSYYQPGNSIKEFLNKFDKFIDWPRSGGRDRFDRFFETDPAPSKILTQKELTEALKELRNEANSKTLGSADDAQQGEDFSQNIAEIAGQS